MHRCPLGDVPDIVSRKLPRMRIFRQDWLPMNTLLDCTYESHLGINIFFNHLIRRMMYVMIKNAIRLLFDELKENFNTCTNNRVKKRRIKALFRNIS
jgi:hypothetical protein